LANDLMEWTAQNFIARVLNPRTSDPPWWADLLGEDRQGGPPGRYLNRTLPAELTGDIPDYRGTGRQLFFFSIRPDRATPRSIDGRAGVVGVEEKCANLTPDKIVDGAIHRGVVWVLGNPQVVVAPEAVSLYVVKQGSTPMVPAVSEALTPVLGSLKEVGIHIVFLHGETGQSWMMSNTKEPGPMPAWLGVTAVPNLAPLPPVGDYAMAQLNSIEWLVGREVSFFGGKRVYKSYDADHGVKLARIEWPNEWQMIEVGLLLRGLGHDAAKVVYCGDPIFGARRGVERRIQAELLRRFGVLLEWRVPI
jgi:hypothetical protein